MTDDYKIARAEIVARFPAGTAARVEIEGARVIDVVIVDHGANGYSNVRDARGPFIVHTSCITERVPDAVTIAAYERGLRRGLAVAREHYVKVDGPCACDMDTFDVDWESSEEALKLEAYAASMGEEVPR
jgi:hypothetical protein